MFVCVGGGEGGEGGYRRQCKTYKAPTVYVRVDFMKKIGALAKPSKIPSLIWFSNLIASEQGAAIAYYSYIIM